MITTPDAAMLDSTLFVSRLDDPFPNLYERFWDGVEWIWIDHGRPGNERITQAPGAAMRNEKLFVVTETGNLWERNWRPDLGRWAWDDHGRPPGVHLATAPGAAMLDAKLFVGGDNAHLFERVWTGGGVGGAGWAWVDHGTAFHDTSEEVISPAPGTPAMTIAVMGDGYAEPDMEAYRRAVRDQVTAAFGLDQLGANRDRIRLVRIDVVSPVTGVTERRYDDAGTPGNASDDTLISEDFKFSRLGLILLFNLWGFWPVIGLGLSGVSPR